MAKKFAYLQKKQYFCRLNNLCSTHQHASKSIIHSTIARIGSSAYASAVAGLG